MAKVIVVGIRKNLPEKRDYIWEYRYKNGPLVKLTRQEAKSKISELKADEKTYQIYGLKMLEA